MQARVREVLLQVASALLVIVVSSVVVTTSAAVEVLAVLALVCT